MPNTESIPAAGGSILCEAITPTQAWYDREYRFTATPNYGYRFVKYTIYIKYVYEDGSEEILHADVTDNPITQPEYDGGEGSVMGHSRLIHKVEAYFEQISYTGLILRSASSGIILRGNAGIILRDA